MNFNIGSIGSAISGLGKESRKNEGDSREKYVKGLTQEPGRAEIVLPDDPDSCLPYSRERDSGSRWTR